MKEEVWNIKRILDWSSEYLLKAGSPTARLDAELLLSETLGLKRIDLYVNYDRPLAEEEKDSFRDVLKRRANLEPIAYILGEKEFFGHVFKVDSSTLIPRPDTEHLVSWVLEHVKDNPAKILDIGTGSGCIAITLAKELGEVTVEAWDVSPGALKIAGNNAGVLGVIDKVSFYEKDALSLDSWTSSSEKFDVIVSNPPYISSMEKNVMAPETLAFEPESALFAEREGLKFYECFAVNAQNLLNKGCPIVLEIGYNQKEKVSSIFASAGWENIEIINDYSGHPRVLVAFSS